jgi:DNA-binding CsgD family transcriptional regulator
MPVKLCYAPAQVPPGVGAAVTGNLEGDRDAILDVIARETSAYFTKDYEGWASCWVHAPYARRWSSYARGGIELHEGWDEVSAVMRASMERGPAPNPSAGQVRRDRMTIQIGAAMAWVTFDQHGPTTGDPFDVPGLQHEMRILEKADGAWKIACCAELQPWIEHTDCPLLRVDGRSIVLWMNGQAEERLRDHGGLTVSAGRLRARNRSADKTLQSIVSWAAGMSGYMDRQAARTVAPGIRIALPVVLAEDPTVGMPVCWVIADGGMVLVSFDDAGTTKRRLSAAALIFGLSPAQARLAALVLDGNDLAQAAAELGVSINTVRTHLQRMFDKTGVRSQPALVRVLLSVGSPLA